MIVLCADGEGLAKLGVQPDGLDGGWTRTDWRTTTSPTQDLVDVETGLGFFCEFVDRSQA